ncbi:hypothetical protein [Methylobacterium sp. JK268]
MAAARRKASAGVAQVGAGDERVLAHPAFRQIPACLFPLSTDEAGREYDRLARVLFDAGRLTLARHSALSAYAMQFDAVITATHQGKPLRASWFAQMDRARRELDLDGIDKPIAAPASAPLNKFARTGFANRR